MCTNTDSVSTVDKIINQLNSSTQGVFVFTSQQFMFTSQHFMFTSQHFMFTSQHFMFTSHHFMFTSHHFMFTSQQFMFTSHHFMFTFQQLRLQRTRLSKSMKHFNPHINANSKLASSKILNFTCKYIEWLQRKPSRSEILLTIIYKLER